MADINDILKIRTNNLNPARGRILISEPFLIDYYFRRSVVLLAEHNEEGSFGLILNKPIDINLDEMVQGFPKLNFPIYLGGPVNTDNIFFIHTRGDLIDESMKVMDRLFWGGDIEQIKELLLIGELSPSEIKFFVGYSGWVSKQLENELTRNSWLVSVINSKQIMNNNPDKMWASVVKSMGQEYAYWSKFPTDPALN